MYISISGSLKKATSADVLVENGYMPDGFRPTGTMQRAPIYVGSGEVGLFALDRDGKIRIRTEAAKAVGVAVQLSLSYPV